LERRWRTCHGIHPGHFESLWRPHKASRLGSPLSACTSHYGPLRI